MLAHLKRLLEINLKFIDYNWFQKKAIKLIQCHERVANHQKIKKLCGLVSYILWFTRAMGGNFHAMLFKTSRQSESGSSRHVVDPCLSSMPLVLCKPQQNICSLILAKCTSLVCDVVCNTKQWAAETRVLILAKHKTSSMFAAVLATTV